MLTVLHKKLIAPLFEAISTRSSQNLNANIFALALIETDTMDSELFYKSSSPLDDIELAAIKRNVRRKWLTAKQDGFKITCESLSDKPGEENHCYYFMQVFNCNVIINIPFELEEIGGGILFWGWKEKPERFSENYVEKSKLIAEQIKLSLNLSLKEQKGQELAAKMAALLELSTAIYSSLNYTEVLGKAIRLSMKIVGADGGSVLILDKKDNRIKPLITIDKSHEEEISKVELRIGEGLTGRVVQTGAGIISNYNEEDPRVFQIPDTPDEPESIISAPLTWSGEVIGAITLRSSECKTFDQEDLNILTIIARQTADAIENAKLYESLEKAYKKLTNTQEQLVMTEKLRALGEMAGGVAHDFNNVLGTILGRTQLLLREVANTKWLEHLEQIEKVTLAGAKTVQKLQNFTRISNRGHFEHVDLTQVIEDSIEATKPKWKDDCQRQGIYVELRRNIEELNLILGNNTELIEAISNVILNAVDALPEGGVIDINAFEENNRAVIKIADNGVGMANSTLNRIFYPFFSTKGINSTGMGLAVVYGIVNHHNGEIDISSELGKGTTCTIYFPVALKAEPKSSRSVEVTGDIKARILVVDDDDNIRDVMTDMLEFMEHTVTAAASGEEGVELFKNGEYDLVLTDLGMPGISGWEVTRICRSLKPNVPVVMISGWGNQIDDQQFKESGLAAVMSKPFEMNRIKSMIQQVLADNRGSSVDSLTGTT